MALRNLASEQPGTRYGSRVVLGATVVLIGETKYRALHVICDCGRTDTVRKSTLVAGRADRCPDCQAEHRAQMMRGVWAGRRWTQRSDVTVKRALSRWLRDLRLEGNGK